MEWFLPFQPIASGISPLEQPCSLSTMPQRERRNQTSAIATSRTCVMSLYRTKGPPMASPGIHGVHRLRYVE